jgi:transcriptional regulator with XRE-family HTH domain
VKLARLKEWREARGFTQKELSLEAGVGAKTIARIELGDSVRTTTARKVADALGVTVVDLMENPPVPLVQAPPPETEQPETGRHISRPVHDSIAVSDSVKATIFGHLDALEVALKTHGLNGELSELVGQMREVVLAS